MLSLPSNLWLNLCVIYLSNDDRILHEGPSKVLHPIYCHHLLPLQFFSLYFSFNPLLILHSSVRVCIPLDNFITISAQPSKLPDASYFIFFRVFPSPNPILCFLRPGVLCALRINCDKLFPNPILFRDKSGAEENPSSSVSVTNICSFFPHSYSFRKI